MLGKSDPLTSSQLGGHRIPRYLQVLLVSLIPCMVFIPLCVWRGTQIAVGWCFVTAVALAAIVLALAVPLRPSPGTRDLPPYLDLYLKSAAISIGLHVILIVPIMIAEWEAVGWSLFYPSYAALDQLGLLRDGGRLADILADAVFSARTIFLVGIFANSFVAGALVVGIRFAVRGHLPSRKHGRRTS
jgi:hypothetical protein